MPSLLLSSIQTSIERGDLARAILIIDRIAPAAMSMVPEIRSRAVDILVFGTDTTMVERYFTARVRAAAAVTGGWILR